ncbi:MAG: hypothetical protein KDC83_13420 [Flavobacteriales bacterium]|nr:hypothetical protein [Flavobacteriaceae bacterium]MCB0482422.1 hypothetical protein [Flavobacteriales bacterium]
MKRLFNILFFTLLVSFGGYAQNELEFGRVINETLTGTGSSVYTKSITIPQGKIWKITFASLGRQGTQGGVQSGVTSQLSIDNFHLKSGSNTISEFPIWLDSGTHTLYIYANDLTPHVAAINGIEFILR